MMRIRGAMGIAAVLLAVSAPAAGTALATEAAPITGLAGQAALAGAANDDVLARRLDDRVKLQRTAHRGMEFVPIARAGSAKNGKSKLAIDIVNQIELDGNALDNVFSSLLPLDFNNNGTAEFLHWNGHRIMRLYGGKGNKIWEISNSSGRRQGKEAWTHRDTAAILDLNGDKKEDVLHCWQSGSTRLLVARNGANGKEIRKVSLSGQSNSAGSLCLISVYRKQSDKKPIVIVAQQQPGGSAKCDSKNYVDNYTRVAAYDTNLKLLWTTDTCHAGHQTAGVDTNGDGYMEYFFAGKYALDFNGKIRCSLSGWNSKDHVDAIRVGQLDPASSRFTAVALGATGGGGFNAADCKRLWTMPKEIKNPQELSIAQLDPAPKPLSITVTERGSDTTKSYVLDKDGKIVRTIGHRVVPMQNAELDGDTRTDELVSMFGNVFNSAGSKILTNSWYWNLKGSKVKQVATANEYEAWTAFPLLYDVDNDGRDELVTWGQSLIAVGRPR
ncbi:MAG TPA: hypothetical protein VNS22_00770 [Geminicoccus sp.]|uniref:hypothetical protein n=1 Tax=Geminicoccus sp. TaxID=2024832 RepID=UPI002B7A34ED|nr:hypothetical protein [Geminicoccus sp.]HWL66897.1 hypothetical protein [Geminicoccus sp.]